MAQSPRNRSFTTVICLMMLSACGPQGLQVGSPYEITAPGHPLPKHNYNMCIAIDSVNRCTSYSENSDTCINPKGINANPPVVQCSSIKAGK